MKYPTLVFLFFLNTIFSSNSNNIYDDIICPLLNQYQRSFTLIDIGCTIDTHSFKIAQNYDSVCVISSTDKQVLNSCKDQNIQNVILLNKGFTPDELKHLNECEHFDVIFGLNIKEKFKDHWHEAVIAILHLGDYVILETSIDDNNIEKIISTEAGLILDKKICNDKQTSIYIIKMPNKYLKRKTWLRSVMDKNIYKIESTFTEKNLIKPISWPKNNFCTTSWVPGINLCTFKMCNGIYPTNEMLKQSLTNLKNVEHTDWLINNMVVQGDKLSLIDCDDESCKMFFSEESFKAHEEILDLDEPIKIEHYFWNKLIKIPITKRIITKSFSQLFHANSLVFDIASCDKELIGNYLSYGAKVICFEPNIDVKKMICKNFSRENIFIVNKESLMQKTGKSLFIDNMIDIYGMPEFCKIHADSNLVLEYLKNHTKIVNCMCFKFDVYFKDDLILCLNCLSLLGYKKFNFSIRELPGFILESNKYIGLVKDWAKSTNELLNEIDKLCNLDHNPKDLCGYIYAKA